VVARPCAGSGRAFRNIPRSPGPESRLARADVEDAGVTR
jgi:hypothetical protein